MSFGSTDEGLNAIADTAYATDFEDSEGTSAAVVFAGFDIDTDDLPLDENS